MNKEFFDIDLGSNITIEGKTYSVNQNQMEAFSDLIEYNEKIEKNLYKYQKKVSKKRDKSIWTEEDNNKFVQRQMEMQDVRKLFQFIKVGNSTILNIYYQYDYNDGKPKNVIIVK